jgi:hypothetical protein
MSHRIIRAASVLLGVIGACCVAMAAALLAIWVMDGSGFASAWPEALGSVVIGACGASMLWLRRTLRRFIESENAVKPTLVT